MFSCVCSCSSLLSFPKGICGCSCPSWVVIPERNLRLLVPFLVVIPQRSVGICISDHLNPEGNPSKAAPETPAQYPNTVARLR